MRFTWDTKTFSSLPQRFSADTQTVGDFCLRKFILIFQYKLTEVIIQRKIHPLTIYPILINMLGGTCVFVDSYPDFRLPLEGIAARVTSRTKLIIVNSPSNPTGAVYAREELQALADLAAAHDIIDNDGPLEDVEPQVNRLHHRYLELFSRGS